MTWGEIQVIALEKMFLGDKILEVNALSQLRNDSTYNLYLSKMYSTANEALQRIYAYGYPKYTKNEDGTYSKTTVEKLSTSTDDDYEMTTYDEACVLIPFYIASQLYKDDDVSLATQYRNEFETGLETLPSNIENSQIEIVLEV